MTKAELEEKIEELEDKITDLESDIEDQNNEIDSLESDLSDTEDRVSELENMEDKKNIDAFSEEVLESSLLWKPVYIWDCKFKRVYISTD